MDSSGLMPALAFNAKSKLGRDDLSDDSSDLNSDFDELDIAITHEPNETLRQRDVVKRFFNEFQKQSSLKEPETRRWFGSLPLRMSKEAIPLFTHDEDGSYEEYQLHPSYTWLKLGKSDEMPHVDLFRLSIEGGTPELPEELDFVMCLGRLFVKEGRSRRTRSKWTGYEVFVNINLSLWMVFDQHSTSRPAESLLSDPFRDPPSPGWEGKTDFGDIARLCHLQDVKSDFGPFKVVQSTVDETRVRCAKLQVDQLDRRAIPSFDNSQLEEGSESSLDLLEDFTMPYSLLLLDNSRVEERPDTPPTPEIPPRFG